jgi:hypothetical protein
MEQEVAGELQARDAAAGRTGFLIISRGYVHCGQMWQLACGTGGRLSGDLGGAYLAGCPKMCAMNDQASLPSSP